MNNKNKTPTNKKKKRGRKKKCEMNLENTDKMKEFITHFDTTENNELRFDTLAKNTNPEGVGDLKSENNENSENDENSEKEEYEEIRFGGIVIKKHKTNEPNTTELHRKFIMSTAANNNDNNNNQPNENESNTCEINLNLINLSLDDSDSDDSLEDNKKAVKKKTVRTTKFKSKKVGVSDLIQVNSTNEISGEPICRTLKSSKIHKNRNTDFNFLESMTILKHYGDNIEEWPQKTDICCWWCCHTFETPPAFIPTHYDSFNKRFKITGNFCTWNCAKSYLFGEMSFQNRQSVHYFTSLLLSLKIKPYDIKPAPPRLTLKIFGGSLSIDDFRKHSLYRETGKYKVATKKMHLDDECKIRHYF